MAVVLDAARTSAASLLAHRRLCRRQQKAVPPRVAPCHNPCRGTCCTSHRVAPCSSEYVLLSAGGTCGGRQLVSVPGRCGGHPAVCRANVDRAAVALPAGCGEGACEFAATETEATFGRQLLGCRMLSLRLCMVPLPYGLLCGSLYTDAKTEAGRPWNCCIAVGCRPASMFLLRSGQQ